MDRERSSIRGEVPVSRQVRLHALGHIQTGHRPKDQFMNSGPEPADLKGRRLSDFTVRSDAQEGIAGPFGFPRTSDHEAHNNETTLFRHGSRTPAHLVSIDR